MAGKHWAAALLAAVTMCLTACGAAAEPEEHPSPETPVFTVDLLSTGKSDCALIRMDGLTILSDAADEDDFAAICALLDSYGVERIDYMILSHYDKDHIGSAAALVRAYPVGEILGPDYEENSTEYAALEAACRDTGTLWTRLTEDRLAATEHGRFLADPPDRDYGDDNNNSIVTTVTWEGESFLFLGDAQKKRMEEFLDVAEARYFFVKLPHHGDSNKPLLQLIRDTAPPWAAETVSVFESVEPALLQALEGAGTELLLTRDGEIHIQWDGTGFSVIQR